MNKTQAMAALKRLYGKNAMWRYDERAPTADERAEAQEQLPVLRETMRAAKEARDRRRAELLADPLYVQLCKDAQDADKAYNEVEYKAHRHYRVTVGRSSGIAFHIEAQGDNWHDAIEKAKAAKARS